MRSRPLKRKFYTVYKVDHLQKRRRRRIALWSVTGFVVVMLAVAGGAYLWFHSLVKGAQIDDAGLKSAVEATFEGSIGSPTGMDILVIGADRRPGEEGGEIRSDAMILVHADPEENYLSLLSIPRDLRVEVPGHGMVKLNAAFAQGGPELTLKAVEQLTQVDIKEYIQLDFRAFSDIVDAVGGVYVDIDRRYYNDNPEFELIKISPGYQLLNGAHALDYVRFRHDLNFDFGRMDRQQRFIAAVREQALGWNLVTDLPGMVNALFHNLVTTLDTNQVLRLANWGARLSGDRIRQVAIVGEIQDRGGVSYVIPAEGAIEEAVQKLMTPPSAEGEGVAASGPSVNGGSQGATGPSTNSTMITSPTVTGNATVTTDSTTSTIEKAKTFITDPRRIANSRLWSRYAAAAPFPVFAPGYIPDGYAYVDRRPVEAGAYDIAIGGGKTAPGIKVVYQFTTLEGDKTDQYMGIMQTPWVDAPAAGPGTQVEKNGVTYTFVGTDQRTERVWWVQDGVLCWVSNTLSYVMNRAQLLNVAESMIPIPRGAGAE